MAENPKCPIHGVEVPPSGQCPKCLIGLGLEAAEASPSSADAAARKRPRQFAGYNLIRQIGCGGMGVVYEAIEIDLNRTVALKLILDSQACSPVARRRFLIEAEAAARLDHPNIVPIYHVGEHEDQPFMSMKLVKGESLRVRIDRGEFRLTQDGTNKAASLQKSIARLVATLARAVHHAHTQNVVHRDLKPGNVLIDGDDVPHLTDFGLAKILDDQRQGVTAPTTILGTPAYMAPEQVRAERVTEAADTYSLGVILYELLVGQLPFRGGTLIETLRLIEEHSSTSPRSLNKHIDRDLETICLKCLEKNPANRYSSTADLADDLDRWLRNEPIKARPLGLWRRTGRWIKRNPLGTALIASLTFGLAAAMAYIHQTGEANKAKALRDADLQDHLQEVVGWRTDALWNHPGRTNLVISAEELAGLTSLRLPAGTNVQRLTFAFNIRANPIVQAIAFAPLIEHLQNQMSPTLGRPVIFDMKFCKSPQWSFLEIVETNTDFQRLGAVSFLTAQRLSPGVQAVVQDDAGKEGVILVRTNSPITTNNLSLFLGRAFAGGDDYSTICQWAKVYLARAGVLKTNLSDYQVFDEAILPMEETTGNTVGTSRGELVSGVSAVQAVLDGSRVLARDFVNLSALLTRLRAGSDSVSRFLWSQFSPEARHVLTNSTATATNKWPQVLAEELNRVLEGPSIFEAQRFAGVQLSTNTLLWMSRDPKGDDLVRLNRLLLEDAYPQEMAKRRHFDGAPLNRENFNRKSYRGLREVYSFRSTPNVYVAGAHVDPKVVSAFRDAMLKITDAGLLGSLPLRPKVQHFELPNETGLADLRAALANEVRQFDGLSPLSPPAAPESPGVNPSPR